MLTLNPGSRISAEDALAHPFVGELHADNVDNEPTAPRYSTIAPYTTVSTVSTVSSAAVFESSAVDWDVRAYCLGGHEELWPFGKRR